MEIWTQGDDEEDRQPAPTLHVRSRSQHIQRLVDRRLSAVESLLAAVRQRGHAESLDADAWTSEDISGPNVTDKETILSFAKMTLDAYYLEPFVGDWRDVKGGFNYSQSFGWEADGLRGHIFADKDNSTIVIGLKGTSAGTFLPPRLRRNSEVRLTYFQQYLTAPRLPQTIRSMTTSSLVVAVLSKGTFSGGRYATAAQKHILAIRRVSLKR